MPKIYEYLGITLFLYSNDHEPIHVHARKGEFESKAEIILENGVITEIILVNVTGRKPLKGTDLNNLKSFLEKYAESIVAKWVDYFVYHKDLKFERINQKL